MPRFTASRRAAVATAVGLALPLSLVVFSQVSQMVAAPTAGVACSLIWIYGDLVADNGRTVLVTSPNYNPYWDGPVPLDWPDDWTIRPGLGGQLDVADGSGTVRGRTGTFVHVTAETDPASIGSILFRDGELVVCPDHGLVPDRFPRPDDWTTETPHNQP